MNPLWCLNISPVSNSSRNSKWDLYYTKSNVIFNLYYRWNLEDDAKNTVFTRCDCSFVWFCTYFILNDIFSGRWNMQWFHSQKQSKFSLFKWFDKVHYRHSKIHSSKKYIHFILIYTHSFLFDASICSHCLLGYVLLFPPLPSFILLFLPSLPSLALLHILTEWLLRS